MLATPSKVIRHFCNYTTACYIVSNASNIILVIVPAPVLEVIPQNQLMQHCYYTLLLHTVNSHACVSSIYMHAQPAIDLPRHSNASDVCRHIH